MLTAHLEPTHITLPFPSALTPQWPDLWLPLTLGTHWLQAVVSVMLSICFFLRPSQSKAGWDVANLPDAAGCYFLLSREKHCFFSENCNNFLWKLFLESWLKERNVKNLRSLWIYEVLRDSVFVCQKHLCRLEKNNEQIVDVSCKKYLDLVFLWIFFLNSYYHANSLYCEYLLNWSIPLPEFACIT